MLARADAALIIGDAALFLNPQSSIKSAIESSIKSAIRDPQSAIRKLDLGELWTASTGLPFVYALWAGWPGAIGPEDVALLQRARDEGVADSDGVALAYYSDDPVRRGVAERNLRDNIRYYLGEDELEGLRTFYRYAAELDLVSFDGTLRFY